jgi:hypothetical protein
MVITPLMILLIATGGERSVSVEPFCHATKDELSVHILLKTTWPANSGGVSEVAGDNEKVLQLNCKLKTKACGGATLDARLSRDGAGNPVVKFLSLTTISGAVLNSFVGDVAIVEWGSYQFVIDLGEATVRSTFKGQKERGLGSCGATSTK